MDKIGTIELVVINGEEFQLVHPPFGCPACGERDVDKLVWDEDGFTVICETCDHEYSIPLYY